MNNGRITPALCCCVTGSLSLMFFQSMCRLFLLFSWFFCVCCSVENVPVRNSDVDYRLLEAAKAGDLDTVKVDDTLKMTIWHCCLWGVMLQSQENAGDCSMTSKLLWLFAIVFEMVALKTVIVTVCSRLPSSKQHQYIRIVKKWMWSQSAISLGLNGVKLALCNNMVIKW